MLTKVVNGVRYEISPTEEQAIKNAWAEEDRKQAEYERDYGYIKKREKEYPSIAEQLDMLFHAMDSGEISRASEWYNSIKAIKDKYPKPTGQ